MRLHSWEDPEQLQLVLQYRFSDGTVLTGNEILRHQYAKCLPMDLLPLLPVATKRPLEKSPKSHFLLAPIAKSGITSIERMELETAYLRVFECAKEANIPLYFLLGNYFPNKSYLGRELEMGVSLMAMLEAIKICRR